MDTEHNDEAVRFLEAVLNTLDVSNRRFAELLSEELGVSISENVLGYYLGVKSRRQPVPAAVIYAAARLSGLPLDRLPRRTLEARIKRLEELIGERPEIRR